MSNAGTFVGSTGPGDNAPATVHVAEAFDAVLDLSQFLQADAAVITCGCRPPQATMRDELLADLRGLTRWRIRYSTTASMT